MLNIDGGNTPVLAFVLRQKLLQLLQEVVLASNAVKCIRLHCADVCILIRFIKHDQSLAVGKIASFRHSLCDTLMNSIAQMCNFGNRFRQL